VLEDSFRHSFESAAAFVIRNHDCLPTIRYYPVMLASGRLSLARKVLAPLSLVVVFSLGSTALAPSAAASTSSHWCECVEYVKNYFALHGAAGNAKDMGPFLAAHGFRRSDTPAIGDVVVVQPAFYSSGSGAIYGHSAIIESLAPAGTTGWFLGLRSANQTGKQFAASTCANVTFKSVGPVARTSRLVSYWTPPHH
jgi:hypothetical protein